MAGGLAGAAGWARPSCRPGQPVWQWSIGQSWLIQDSADSTSRSGGEKQGNNSSRRRSTRGSRSEAARDGTFFVVGAGRSGGRCGGGRRGGMRVGLVLERKKNKGFCTLGSGPVRNERLQAVCLWRPPNKQQSDPSYNKDFFFLILHYI